MNSYCRGIRNLTLCFLPLKIMKPGRSQKTYSPTPDVPSLGHWSRTEHLLCATQQRCDQCQGHRLFSSLHSSRIFCLRCAKCICYRIARTLGWRPWELWGIQKWEAKGPRERKGPHKVVSELRNWDWGVIALGPASCPQVLQPTPAPEWPIWNEVPACPSICPPSMWCWWWLLLAAPARCTSA